MLASEDIRPISYLKTHTAETISQVNETLRPIYITQNGQPKAVVLDTITYEKIQKGLDLLKIVYQGEQDIEANRFADHDKAMKKFRKKYFKNR